MRRRIDLWIYNTLNMYIEMDDLNWTSRKCKIYYLFYLGQVDWNVVIYWWSSNRVSLLVVIHILWSEGKQWMNQISHNANRIHTNTGRFATSPLGDFIITLLLYKVKSNYCYFYTYDMCPFSKQFDTLTIHVCVLKMMMTFNWWCPVFKTHTPPHIHTHTHTHGWLGTIHGVLWVALWIQCIYTSIYTCIFVIIFINLRWWHIMIPCMVSVSHGARLLPGRWLYIT